MSRLVILLACLLLSALGGQAERRQILQTAIDGLVVGDFTDDETADTVYQTVSTNLGSLQQYSSSNSTGWGVSVVNATIELSTNATYAYNYNAGNGTSRFNVTVTLTKTGSAANPPVVTASISTANCNGDVQSNLLLSNMTTTALSGLTVVPSSNSITKAGNQTGSIIYQELIEYEDANSVGIYLGGNLVACQNLQPPFPNFPNDWSATIENTDSVNGTTFVLVEQYSQSMNKIRLDLHSFGANRIIITDTSSSSVTFINPQNGSCSSRTTRRTNWITGKDNTTLLSTAEMLHFSANQVSYMPGTYYARGIACEVWAASVNISNNWANATFNASFYFPVDQWLVNREDYHRLLKQVTLVGMWNNMPMNQTFSYIDFRPRSFTSPSFEICAISPYGAGCNCTATLRRQAFANVPAVEDSLSDGDNLAVDGSLSSLCKEANPVPHGFISAQSGPYVGLTIIGMIGGALITGLVMFFVHRRRGGVMISDPMRHEKFTDAPGA